MKAMSGQWARYDILSTVEHKQPPVSEILLTIGPKAKSHEIVRRWWELKIKTESGESFSIRVLSDNAPMTEASIGEIARYILMEDNSQPVEYIDIRTGKALLPKLASVTELFPQPCPHSGSVDGFQTSGTYLGHVISLAETSTTSSWKKWPVPKVLRFNPDEIHYMYGLAKDAEGRYISDGDYTYIPLTKKELRELITLGLNCLMVGDEQEEWIAFEPTFYYKQFGSNSKPNYPLILYRPNYRGAVPFIDEPEIHVLHDKEDLAKIKRPEEGALLITKRLEEIWNCPAENEYRRGLLRSQLQKNGVNLGTLNLDDIDHPIWVTMNETSFYQLAGGASGIVHEGRYNIEQFVKDSERFIGKGLQITAEEMLRIEYAYLRGAARTFGKYWGTAIYGQCDPNIAPMALTLAYDMGARYIWLWTYDHQHHLPHFMKLKLLRKLKAHKKAHPRGNPTDLLYAAKTAILIPYGYGYHIGFDQLWESPHLRVTKTNALGVPHREIAGAALAEGIACAKMGEDFDFVVDVSQKLSGYTRVVRIGLDGIVRDSLPPIKPKVVRSYTIKPDDWYPLEEPAQIASQNIAAAIDDTLRVMNERDNIRFRLATHADFPQTGRLNISLTHNGKKAVLANIPIDIPVGRASLCVTIVIEDLPLGTYLCHISLRIGRKIISKSRFPIYILWQSTT